MTDDKEIENIYVVPRTTTCSKTTFSLSLVSAQITADGLVDDFYQNYPEQVTMDYINSYVSSHKKEMDAAVDEFLYHFQDSSTLAAHLKTLLKENPKVEESIAKENLLQYLDLLVLINYMSGGKNDDVVQVFLDEKNRNGAENFAVVFMGAVVSWGTNTDFTWLSFPANMYAACSCNSLTDYGSLTCSTFETADPLKQTNSSIEYSSANSKYAEEYWQALTNLDSIKARFNANPKHTRGANIARMWFTVAVGKKHYSLSDAYGTAFTLMPTDIFGNQKGTLGFTYFSTAGIALPEVPSSNGGEISLKVDSSNNTTVEKGGLTSATYVISLKSSEEQQTSLKETFAYAEKEGYKVNVRITVAGKAIEGNPKNTCYYDTVQTGEKIGSNGVIAFDDISYDDFKPYLTGEKDIKITDADISIQADTRIEYRATCTLKVGDGKSEEQPTIKFTAIGAATEQDKDNFCAIAKDTWKCTYLEPEFNATRVHYYSEPETPYVEIKQGSPTNETYEAMAGVPTTEDLYLGFGATEFIINLEAEHKQQSDAKRNYTTTYTA